MPNIKANKFSNDAKRKGKQKQNEPSNKGSIISAQVVYLQEVLN